jgi:hypothetical protein
MRTVLDSSKAARVSAGILFIDVASAFATMLRRIWFNTNQGDEQWIGSLRNNGFNEEEIKQIFDYVALVHYGQDENGVIYSDENHCMSLTYALCKQLYANTWVSTEGISGVISTCEGSCAGMPLADLVYGFAMSRVITRIRLRLVNIQGNTNGEFSNVSIRGASHRIVDVSFYDDTAFMFVNTACDIVCTVSTTSSCIFDTFAMFYLDVNMSKNKTECIISFYGDGANIAKRQLARDGIDIPVPCKNRHCASTRSSSIQAFGYSYHCYCCFMCRGSPHQGGNHVTTGEKVQQGVQTCGHSFAQEAACYPGLHYF